MPRTFLANLHRKTLEDTLLETFRRLLARIAPSDEEDIDLLMDSIKYGMDCLMDLMAPQRNIPFIGKTPHKAHYFARDADGVEDAHEQLAHLENPSTNLAALGDSFVPEVRSALLQLVALLRQKQREYEILEATGGTRRIRSARQTRSARNRSARNRSARNRSARNRSARNRITRRCI